MMDDTLREGLEEMAREHEEHHAQDVAAALADLTAAKLFGTKEDIRRALADYRALTDPD